MFLVTTHGLREPCKVIMHTGTGQVSCHLTAPLVTGNWGHVGQLLPRSLGRSSHNLSSTIQSSDVKGVLLVLLNSGIWPERLAASAPPPQCLTHWVIYSYCIPSLLGSPLLDPPSFLIFLIMQLTAPSLSQGHFCDPFRGMRDVWLLPMAL